MSKAQEYSGLKNGSYFYITNRDRQLSLTYPADLPNATLHFATLNENRPDQIWMIEQVQPNKYEIVHAYTTFVLTTTKKGVKLNYGYQSSDQLFFLQKSDPKNNPLQYWIKENKLSQKYLFYDVDLKFGEANPKASKCRWQLKRISNNNELLQSSLVQFAYSGMYLDVPGSSVKQGITIEQYPHNGRCNQRWKLQKVPNSEGYVILSVRSKMCLSIKGRKNKIGTEIVQQHPKNQDLGQLWKLSHQGGSLYIISSLLEVNLFLGVKSNSMDECAKIVITNEESYAFWKIQGNLP